MTEYRGGIESDKQVGEARALKAKLVERTPLLIAGIVAAAWVSAALVRASYDSPNVDDYLYATMSRELWWRIASWRVDAALGAILGTGQVAPLLLVLGAPLSHFGIDGILWVQLPLLLGLAVLIATWVARTEGTAHGWLAAAAVALTPPVFAWSLMVHMALASTVCMMATLFLFVRSNGFANRTYSLATGVSMGLLAVSRSMALVYVGAVGLSMLLSLTMFHRGWMRRHAQNVALAVAATLAVAGPWYLVSGRSALAYLTSVGYSARSGFVGRGSAVAIRMASLQELAGVAMIVVVTLLLARVLLAFSRGEIWKDPERAESLLLTLSCGCAGLAVLLSSRVPGTAFDLPPAVALTTAAFLGGPCRPSTTRAIAVAVLSLVSLTLGTEFPAAGVGGPSMVGASAPLRGRSSSGNRPTAVGDEQLELDNR